MDKPNVVLLNSGGLDTLVCAKILYNQGYKLYSVFVDFGQPNIERALESAKRITEKYCELGELEVLRLSSNKRETFSTSNMLKSRGLKTRIPWTGITTPLLVGIVSVCENIEYMATGVKEDVPLDYNRRQQTLKELLSEERVGESIITLQPVGKYKTMKESYERGLLEGLTIEEMNDTVSCNSEEPCNSCKKCIDRKNLGLTIS